MLPFLAPFAPLADLLDFLLVSELWEPPEPGLLGKDFPSFCLEFLALPAGFPLVAFFPFLLPLLLLELQGEMGQSQFLKQDSLQNLDLEL